jgi:hypothetical protein
MVWNCNERSGNPDWNRVLRDGKKVGLQPEDVVPRFSTVEMMIYCLLNSNHRLTGPVPGRASPAVRGVLIWDTPIDVPRLKQVNWLVNYVAWEILLIWNLLYCIWKNYW